MEHLIEHGPAEIASVFARVFEMAMQVERERFLGASHYARTEDRRGYANGYKSKRLDTPAGTVNVQVPKTAGHEDEPFYPQSLEKRARAGPGRHAGGSRDVYQRRFHPRCGKP